MKILHIDSSPRGERSHSRALTTAFVAELKLAQPAASVTYHDLGHAPVPHVDEPWIAAAYSDPSKHTAGDKQALAISDGLVDELLASDVIVIGAPMYNFSIPSTLKAWIDQVVRVGRTFSFPDYKGLVSGKKMYVLCARGGGGYGPGEQSEQVNFQDPYLRTIFGLIGITDITFVYDEKTLSGESNLEASVEQARSAARQAA